MIQPFCTLLIASKWRPVNVGLYLTPSAAFATACGTEPPFTRRGLLILITNGYLLMTVNIQFEGNDVCEFFFYYTKVIIDYVDEFLN